jgi:two-component system, OmpR family, sensor histidine kinase MtrB
VASDPVTRRRTRLTRRLGLRARVTAAFTLGALLLSLLLSVATYGLVRGSLLPEREERANEVMYRNADTVRASLRTAPPIASDRANILPDLTNPEGANPVLFYDGEWFAVEGSMGRREIEPIEDIVLSGTPARMRYTLPGRSGTFYAVGTPIPAVDAFYFEITSFSDLDDALTELGVALTAASVITTLAGAAIGASASRRVLRPLANVSAAAEAIAGGRLDTRLAKISDPDLGTLVTSFNDMATALQTRIERDARFASDVSHELRSPLTTLTASIEVLGGRRDELPPRAQFALDLLVADVQRFSTMVEDLLEISRFDAGAAHLELDEVLIAELVRQAVQVSSDVEVPVHVAPDAADAVVEVDKRRLVRVIANLLTNAQKYADGATSVYVGRTEDEVVIIVEDAGPGVEEGDRERIFERFSRAASTAGQRGTSDGVGLGLALVKEHVQLHGGSVSVEDRPDGNTGAHFVVRLPATAPPPDAPMGPDLGDATVPADEMVT